MSSEPRLISVVGEKPLPKYFVYYDEWTGEIISVTSKHFESENPCIKTEDRTAADIMMGILNPKKYQVIETEAGQVIVPKKEAMKIKKAEEVLTKIPAVSVTVDSDINIIRYINSWKIEINMSQDVLYRLTGRRFNHRFNSGDVENNYIEFYITKKNNPMVLIETIKVPLVDLFNDGYVLKDMSHLQSFIGLKDIDVFTKRVFKRYGLKTKQNYVNVDYHTKNSKRRSHTAIEPNPAEGIEYTFSVSPSTGGWIIKSNFDDPSEHKIYRDLHIFLTTKNPHVLLDRIVIPYNKVGHHQEFLLETKVDPTTCKMLVGEEGKNITFKFEEIEYVKSGKY